MARNQGSVEREGMLFWSQAGYSSEQGADMWGREEGEALGWEGGARLGGGRVASLV